MKKDVPVDGEKCNKWKDVVTHCSHNLSRKVGKFKSDLEKPNNLSDMENLRKQLLELRKKQCTEISKSLLYFVNRLIYCEVSRVYVIQWIQNYIDANVKSLLPLLMTQKKLVQKTLEDAQVGGCSEDVLQECTCALNKLNDRIENANFGIEYLLREIGHICDSALEIGGNTNVLGLPTK